jgi:hypothetical protein
VGHGDAGKLGVTTFEAHVERSGQVPLGEVEGVTHVEDGRPIALSFEHLLQVELCGRIGVEQLAVGTVGYGVEEEVGLGAAGCPSVTNSTKRSLLIGARA